MALHLHLTMGGPTCHHVRMALHLHMTMGGPSYNHVRKAPALISNHGKPILPPCRKGLALISNLVIKALHLRLTMAGPTCHHVRMALHLHLTMGGTTPTMSERLSDSSPPLGGNLDLENTKLLPEVLKLHYGQCIGQHISYLFVRRNILELQYSYLHHILDIVILNIDMLEIFMEHRVLRQLHTTLVVTIYTSSIQLEIK